MFKLLPCRYGEAEVWRQMCSNLYPYVRTMKTFHLALLASAFLSMQALAADQIIPGIYQLKPNPSTTTGPVTTADGVVVEHFEQAVPQAAEVRYAVVARRPSGEFGETNEYLLLFLTYKILCHTDNCYGTDSVYNLCIAYATLHDIDNKPFCSIRNEGGNRFSPTFHWEGASFIIRWPDQKKLVPTEYIPPQRKPTPEETFLCAASNGCSLEAFGGYSDYYDITHYTDRFVLKKSRDYRDILHLDKAVPFYKSSDRSSLKQGDVESGTYVAILSQGGEWFEVDRFSPDGQTVRGWINRDDLEGDVHWVEQKVSSESFRFRVAYSTVKSDIQNDPGLTGAVAIEVLDSATGKRVQVIRDFYSEPISASADVLADALGVIDANFDGYPDLTIAGSGGGAGPNFSTNFFLFDPASGSFRFDQELSELSQPSVNTKDRTISSAGRDGCCRHSSTTYRYVRNKLTKIAEVETRWTEDLNGQWLETTNCHLVRGRMRCRTTREPYDGK